MTTPKGRPRPDILLCAIAYTAIGVASSRFSTMETSRSWRWAAWIASGLVFAFHVSLDRSRPNRSAVASASRAALASALGAFGLAVAAIAHTLTSGEGRLGLLVIALLVWPLLTALPAFLVALVLAALFGRLAGTRQAHRA